MLTFQTYLALERVLLVVKILNIRVRHAKTCYVQDVMSSFVLPALKPRLRVREQKLLRGFRSVRNLLRQYRQKYLFGIEIYEPFWTLTISNQNHLTLIKNVFFSNALTYYFSIKLKFFYNIFCVKILLWTLFLFQKNGRL